MRARLIALLILVLIVGTPLGLYWFFYKKNVTSLVFVSETNEPYTVSLEGKLEYEYFPLLDEVFQYKSTCTGSCIFTPIPPLTYTIRISTPGREDILDSITLENGAEKKYGVVLPKILTFEKVGSFVTKVPNTIPADYRALGVSLAGQVVVVSQKREASEIGLYINNSFRSLYRTSDPLSEAKLDRSHQFVIAPRATGDQSIYPLERQWQGVIFPFQDEILHIATDGKSWKVRTQNALYEGNSGNWKKNPRFTDYIDISPRYRLGYISESQKQKLTLQNYPTNTSVIVLLDRLSTNVLVMKRGVSVDGFLLYEGKPAYYDQNGEIFRLDLRGFSE